MSRPEGFLGRWARLKSEARPTAPTETAPPDEIADQAPDGGGLLEPTEAAPDSPAVESAEDEPLDLPDLDTLDADSDYTAFLDPRVPEETHRQALRKLWTSDPVHGFRDGLNEYDEDYTAPAILGTAVKTVYDVVRGYAPAPEDAQETPTAAVGDPAEADQDADAEETPAVADEASGSIHVAQDQGDTTASSG